SPLHFRQECRREIRRIVARADTSCHSTIIVHDASEDRYWSGRSCHHLTRHGSKPKPELQHVPRLLRISPLCDFIEPCCCELRAAQTLRILGRKKLSHDTAWPDDLPF